MQPIATLRTPPSSSWEVPTLASLNKSSSTNAKPLDPFAPLPQSSAPQKRPALVPLTVAAKDTRPTTTEERSADYYLEHVRKQAEEATDFDEGCDELEAAVAVLAATDLHSSSVPKVSVKLLPGATPEKVDILINVYEKNLEEGCVKSLNGIAGKCVEFAKGFRDALHTNGGPITGQTHRDVNGFIRETLLPAIIEHHSPALQKMLPALNNELTKSWDEIKSLPPLRIRPTMYRIIAELGRAMNEKEFTEEKRRISLANAMLKCVELLEDRNETGITIIERSWGKRYPIIAGQKAEADPELKAILSYIPGEQALLNHAVDTFLFDTIGQNKNVPDIMHGERAICPITRTAIKLARFAKAAQIIAESMVDIAYQASDFGIYITAMERGHWWGGGGRLEAAKGKPAGMVGSMAS
ncbi:hypothetical protein M422DRAFT_64549 [Sphaerobolus stellatus SS14]|nr:hypothetical protein M422DRAFT_64549 [Sphaerobolus stellatus SS14]